MGSNLESIAARSAFRTVLVFGASGYVGTNLIPKLRGRGWQVRASARNIDVLRGRGWEDVEVVEADALEPGTLGPALRGIDLAYYLVHSMAAGRHFSRLEEQAARNFAAAAEAAGVGRIVYLGGLIPAEADSEHLVSRKHTGDILRSGAVPVTEVRAGMIVGPGSAAFEVIRDLVNNLPVMVTPRWVESRSPPIALENLLTYLLELPEVDPREDGVYDAAGPEMLTYRELMFEYGRLVAKKPYVISVPVLSPRLSSYWLRFVTTVPTNVARALIEGLKLDIAADNAELCRLVPQRLLGFRESVEAVFKAERENAVAARWIEGALMFRDYNPKYAFYAKRAAGEASTTATPAALWEQVRAIGGENRFYALNFLWTVREFVDRLLGGTGARRRRRHPTELRVGDVLGSWRVIGLEPQRRLTLKMGMRAPGSGVLEFEIAPRSDGSSKISATAFWHPAGVWGLLYWYPIVLPLLTVLKATTRAMARRAEAEDVARNAKQATKS